MDFEKLIIGDWSSDYQGPCLELEHFNIINKFESNNNLNEELLELNLDNLSRILKSSPNLVVIQLKSINKISVDNFLNLISAIGEYCKFLQCMSLNFIFDEDDENFKIYKEFNEVEQNEDHPHYLTWRKFIESTGATLRHICILGDYNIPYFAIKLLTDEKICPEMSIIDGGFSEHCSILNEKSFESTTEANMKHILFLNALDFDVDLEKVSQNLENLKIAWLRTNPEMDLRLFESEKLKRLIHLEINGPTPSPFLFVKQAQTEEQIEEPPNFLLPQESNLRTLEINEVVFTKAAWIELFKRAKLLRSLACKNTLDETSDINYILEEAGEMKRLKYFALNIKNNVKALNIKNFIESTTKNSNESHIRLILKNVDAADYSEILLIAKGLEIFMSDASANIEEEAKERIKFTISIEFNFKDNDVLNKFKWDEVFESSLNILKMEKLENKENGFFIETNEIKCEFSWISELE